MGEVRSIRSADAVTAIAFSLTWPGATLHLHVDGEPRRIKRPILVYELVHRFEQDNRDLRFEVSGGRFGAFWVSVSGTEQNKRLSRLPHPNMVVREGGSSRRTAFWWLSGRPDLLAYAQIAKGNKRLAYACGATQKHGDPDHARFPIPGTCLRDRARPVPVLVEHLDTGEYRPKQVVGRLKDPPPPRDWREAR